MLEAVAKEIRRPADKGWHLARVLEALGSALDPGTIVSLARLRVLYARGVIRALGGNKTAAAKALGINRRALYRILEREAG